jgi:hypothetical protein
LKFIENYEKKLSIFPASYPLNLNEMRVVRANKVEGKRFHILNPQHKKDLRLHKNGK